MPLRVACRLQVSSNLGPQRSAINADAPRADQHESFYREFDSPLMRQIRREACGEDIGQHSWIGADELLQDARRLRLDPARRLLDLGSGPCGPLTFLIASFDCAGAASTSAHRPSKWVMRGPPISGSSEPSRPKLQI